MAFWEIFFMSSDTPKESYSESEESDADDFCPALPPHLLKPKANNKPRIIGPTLPPSITEKDLKELGSKAPEHSDSDSEEIIGPMPLRTENDFMNAEIEREALMKKRALINAANKPQVRDSWMTELPEEKSKLAIFGLGARTFSSKSAPEKGDTSSWTDCPADKERKKLFETDKQKQSKRESSGHDEETTRELVESHNKKKRDTSLMDMHSKKIKSEEPAIKERKPFNREEDMNVNKFDEAQKASIIRKAQQLDDRFSKGSKRYL